MYLAIDASNWICVAWHALSGRGVLTELCRRIEAIIEYLEPSHAVACFDRRSFRHDLYPPYKAHRKPKPAGLQAALEEGPQHVGEICAACAVEGFEADDCLATVARNAQNAGRRAILASPDKDLFQCLVPERVTILRQFTLSKDGVQALDWFNAAALEKHYGLAPRQWIDYQALVGDSTDGVPGCPGWGEKTALPALRTKGSIEAMLSDPWSLKIGPKQQQALISFRRELPLMRQLVTLRDDVAEVWDALR